MTPPALDIQQVEAAVLSVAGADGGKTTNIPANGVILFSKGTEESIRDIAAAFTREAWIAFGAWISQTYEDGKVRWKVLEEANKP